MRAHGGLKNTPRECDDSTLRRSYGMRHGGIYTVEHVKARCIVDEDHGCWLWQGAVSHGGSREDFPIPALYLPAYKKTMSGMRAVKIVQGELAIDAPRTLIVWHSCDHRMCLNPDHLKIGTRAEYGADMKRRGIFRSLLRSASNQATAIKRRTVSDADRRAIRDSAEPLIVVAQRYGTSKSNCSRIRRGERGETAAANGSSVFAWRPQ